MKNGDRLQGKIISMGSGKLVFETPYAGKITIAWDQVEQLTSDKTLEVTLPEKETLKGRAVKGEDGVLILQPETGPATQAHCPVKGFQHVAPQTTPELGMDRERQRGG